MEARRRNLLIAAGSVFLLALAVVLVLVLLPDEPAPDRPLATPAIADAAATDGAATTITPDLAVDAAPARPDARPRPRRGWRAITDRELRAVQRSNSPLLRACYARLSRHTPSMVRQRANVTVELGERGRIRSVVVRAGDRALEGCLRRAVLRWRFSPTLKPQRLDFPVVVAGR